MISTTSNFSPEWKANSPLEGRLFWQTGPLPVNGDPTDDTSRKERLTEAQQRRF
jgi:hypothetical protein